MAVPAMKWHQFLLNEKEIKLFHELRKIEEDGNPASNEDANKLGQILYLSSYASDDQCLGRYHVDARNAIMECAQIGAEIRRKILIAPKIGAEVQDDSTTERDNLDDTQLVYTGQEDVEMDNETITWDDVREDVIPSYVTGVTFTIPEEVLTADRRKALEEHFPGVVIKAALPEPTRVTIGVTKPKGIKSAMFELDRAEVEADPTVEPRIREMYPWASVQTGSGREALTLLPPYEDVTRRYASQQYLHDFTHYTTNPPGKDEFGSKFDIQSGWGSLPFAKKVTTAHARAPISPASNRMIEAVAKKINLELDDPVAIFGMYAEWSQWKKISPYEDNDQLDGYYASLVDLYIIANHQHMGALQYALLLKFQSTNFAFITQKLPQMPIVIKAYQYLSSNNPLCRWGAILYSYLWSTEMDYETFCKDQNRFMDTAVLTKFVYSIARIRCLFTPAQDAAVLKQWCEVHSHTSGSQDERLCNIAKANNMLSIDKAIRAEERRQLNEAEEFIERHGGFVVMRSDSSTSGTLPERPAKRKFEGLSDSGPFKMTNFGGGRGRGRGRGSER